MTWRLPSWPSPIPAGACSSDRKELEGVLEEQITGAQSFLDLHLRTGASIRGFRREDRPEIPAEVLREAVVNAVAHRDYSLRGQVRLFVFADRVEIISPGSLPNTVTLDNIRFGIHVERNPILVTFLAKMGLLSQVGTGIPRMIRAMRDRGLPEPSFALLGDHFRVTIARPVGGSR